MKTKLCYLENPFCFSSYGNVLACMPLDEPDKYAIIVDQSPFFVKGGGQESESGSIKFKENLFNVDQVIRQDNLNLHIGKFYHFLSKIIIGEKVFLEINEAERRRNTTLHTAGELICAAFRILGLDNYVVSAIHYNSHSYIEYDIEPGLSVNIDKLRKILPQMLSDLIKHGFEVKTCYSNDIEEITRLCGFRPTYLNLDEPARLIQVASTFYRPCMGSHLNNINELKEIKEINLKIKKSKLRISYRV